MSGLDVPATIDAATVTDWSDDVDVVVIGFGIAGGCAAVTAAAAGARVLVLERAGAAGGTTAMAGGHFYLGGGTAVQQATGHPDTVEAMYSYLVAMSREPEHDKIRAYCEGSVEHFCWLEDLGVHFERSYYPQKAVIQPGTEGLMYTGNEKVWPYTDLAMPAPRGHKVPVPGDTRGAAMVIDLLLKRAAELGVEIRYETGATNLVLDGGAVAGVAWKHFGDKGTLRAPAVVIAAGGFVMNSDMVAAYTPKLAEKPFVLGNSYDDGLGIRMGVSAGAATKHMDQAFITAPVYPPAILLIRFIDGWETVPEMESSLGIPAGNLVATLNRYNEHAARGEDPDFHKQPEFLATQDHGPWAAFDLSLGKAMYSGFTVGGLATDVDARVLREDGSAIPGLYAAGACASTLAQDSKGYSSGTQLGSGSFFGRRAGAQAAAKASGGQPESLPAPGPDFRSHRQSAAD